MTQAYSKSRQQAEHAFKNLQSKSQARSKAAETASSDVAIRDEKTLRLRTLRLAREQDGA